jgi:hypothetical protein
MKSICMDNIWTIFFNIIGYGEIICSIGLFFCNMKNWTEPLCFFIIGVGFLIFNKFKPKLGY